MLSKSLPITVVHCEYFFIASVLRTGCKDYVSAGLGWTVGVVFFCVADDDFRVKLEGLENNYINASLVEVPLAGRKYILTQVNNYSL